jgi:hypothetical protein
VAVSYRLLITGSRQWTDYDTIHAVIARHIAEHGNITVVVGDARGADALARAATLHLGLVPEEHKADWRCRPQCAARHRGLDYCPEGGFRRNQEMADSGISACEAFDAGCVRPRCLSRPPHPSHGTADCAQRADKAGITVNWNRESK